MQNRKAGRPFGTIRQPIATRLPNGKQPAAYSKWVGMKTRCKNPNSHVWKHYGGRGITVCSRWLGRDGFRNFYADMGEPNGLTIDRIDNDKGYSPDNCKWSTMKEQAANKRKRTLNPNTVRQRYMSTGLSYHLVYLRINRLGWTEARALSTPCLRRGRQTGTTFVDGYKQ
jgi:hypothetical protein